MIFFVALALAAPDVSVVRPTGLGPPSFSPCPVLPKAPAAAKDVDPPSPLEKFPGLMVVDLAAGATRSAEAEGVAARTRGPARLGDEPLRGDAGAIARLRARFRAGGAPLRVAVWGDSHTVGGPLTEQLRRELGSRLGDAGSGFFFPFAPFSAVPVHAVSGCVRGAWTVRSTQRSGPVGFGPAGNGAIGGVDAGLRVTVVDEARPTGELTISVLHRPRADGGTLRATLDGVGTDIRTVGTAPLAVTSFVVPVGSHELDLAVTAGSVDLGGVIVDRTPLSGRGVVVDGLGVGVRPFAAWSAWDQEAMRAIQVWRPYDVFVFSTGNADVLAVDTTETALRESLQAAFSAFRAVAPDASCVIMAPGDRGVRVDDDTFLLWPHQAMANRVLRELAPAAGCVTWDLQAAMGGEGSAVAWRDAGLMSADLLHFTPAGYATIGTRLAELMAPR